MGNPGQVTQISSCQHDVSWYIHLLSPCYEQYLIYARLARLNRKTWLLVRLASGCRAGVMTAFFLHRHLYICSDKVSNAMLLENSIVY